jgi:hypothetical protein
MKFRYIPRWIADIMMIDRIMGGRPYDTLEAQIMETWFLMGNSTPMTPIHYIYPECAADLLEIWNARRHNFFPIYAFVGMRRYGELFDELFRITGPPAVLEYFEEYDVPPDCQAWLEDRMLKHGRAAIRPPRRPSM